MKCAKSHVSTTSYGALPCVQIHKEKLECSALLCCNLNLTGQRSTQDLLHMGLPTESVPACKWLQAVQTTLACSIVATLTTLETEIVLRELSSVGEHRATQRLRSSDTSSIYLERRFQRGKGSK